MPDIIAYLEREDIQRMIKSDPGIVENVIKRQGNPVMPTLGGHTFWDTVQIGEWKFQRYKIEKLVDICRILDGANHVLATGSEEAFSSRFREQINQHIQTAKWIDRTYGIVLSGGGGKGAYEIGVYRFLEERGLAKKITGISGTSVGALNGLLFMQGDYQAAHNLWSNVKQKDMLSVDTTEALKKTAKSLGIAAPAVFTGLMASPGGALIGGGMAAARIATSGVTALRMAPHISGLLGAALSSGIFDQSGIEKLIEEHIDWTKIEHAEKLFYCTVLGTHGLEYRCLTGQDKKDILNSVLESASLPLVYGPRKDTTGWYFDGGLGDNTPISNLVQERFRNIIVIHLQRGTAKNKKNWEKSLKKITRPYQVYDVWPRDELWKGFPGLPSKDFWAMLTINPEISKKRMEWGYEDAKEQLSELVAKTWNR